MVLVDYATCYVLLTSPLTCDHAHLHGRWGVDGLAVDVSNAASQCELCSQSIVSLATVMTIDKI